MTYRIAAIVFISCAPRCIQQRTAASRLGCRWRRRLDLEIWSKIFIATRLAAEDSIRNLILPRLRQLLRVQTPKGFLKKYLFITNYKYYKLSLFGTTILLGYVWRTTASFPSSYWFLSKRSFVCVIMYVLDIISVCDSLLIWILIRQSFFDIFNRNPGSGVKQQDVLWCR